MIKVAINPDRDTDNSYNPPPLEFSKDENGNVKVELSGPSRIVYFSKADWAMLVRIFPGE